MAAFTGTYTSTTYARQVGVLKADPQNGGGADLKRLFFDYTHPSGDDGTGTITLGRTPAGLIVIDPDLSRLVTTQFGTSATISIGFAAYVNSAGATVSASTAALHSAGAAGAGALDVALGAPADGATGLVLDSRDGVDIIATIASGPIEAADTIALKLVISQIG